MLQFVIYICAVALQPTQCDARNADSVYSSPVMYDLVTQCINDGNERAAKLDYPERHYPKIVCLRGRT